MNIYKKINEIRKKPEHIRQRYVLGAVGICMSFVLILWVFSVKENIKSVSEQIGSSRSHISDFKEKFDEQSEEETPSIKEIMDQAGKNLEMGIEAQDNNNENE